jgi:hypothetical protein
MRCDFSRIRGCLLMGGSISLSGKLKSLISLSKILADLKEQCVLQAIVAVAEACMASADQEGSSWLLRFKLFCRFVNSGSHLDWIGRRLVSR